MKYLIRTTETYRVDTVDEVKELHKELENNNHFTLSSFKYQTKIIKDHGEVIGEYQLATATLDINDEKDPYRHIQVKYEAEGE